MTFGSIFADAAFGVAVALLVGVYLDHRKRDWRGKRTDSPHATPNYKGGLRLPKEKP